MYAQYMKRKDPKDRKDYSLQTQCSEEVKDLMRSLADAEEMSVSAYTWRIIKAHLDSLETEVEAE